MPFDQTTRNRLSRFVGDARALLTSEFTRQLQQTYGIDPASGEVTALERLGGLGDAERQTADLLRETAEHYQPGFAQLAPKARRDTIDRIVREQAFTVLNRLCALRMAEARGLLLESIANGYQSRGFQLYARLAGSAQGETGDAYRTYLFSVCDEFAVDLPVLFDRFAPEGRLFPGETALLALLDLVNNAEIEPLWAEDETIGWIYQYFNSKEERKAMRDASAAPRNSRELAVRNQFFTPRYVVEFLADNTLGRTWYEMTQGQTGLVESCRYLVRRPNEIFLAPGEQAPPSLTNESDTPHPPTPSPTSGEGEVADTHLRAASSQSGEEEESDRWNISPALQSRMIEVARQFRKDPTLSEDTLWQALRGRQLEGRKFRRQQPIGSFVVDFYCASERLIVEVDGPIHEQRSGADRARQGLLESLGLRFVRISADTVEQRIDEALTTIRSAFTSNIQPPLPGVGEKSERNSISPLPGVREGAGGEGQDLSQEELLRQPVYIPHRPLKDPRTITMLDPACGSMHFGLYAFDLFERIYEEAWELEERESPPSPTRGEGGRGGEGPRRGRGGLGGEGTLHEAYPDKDAFLRDVPRLIVERNIHGIDIDPRAAQIAGLSLWLRAQKSWREQGLKPQERPKIERSNVVCAEPMPGDTDLLEEFIARQLAATAEDKVVAWMLRRVFDAMTLAGEAGALLKIEDEIDAIIAEAKKQWRRGPKLTQSSLFADEAAPMSQRAMDLDASGITDASFWTRAEERIDAALKDYAAFAEGDGAYRRRLFAGDAARGFAFIDLCRKRYDVVLMNPPFGAAGRELQNLLDKKKYHNRDLASDFVTNALQLAVTDGIVGAITTRTIFFLKGFLDWRDILVDKFGGPRCFLDIGFGVLDAAVEASAFTIQSGQASPVGNYFHALGLNEDLETRGADALFQCRQYLVRAKSFANIPRHPFAYWISSQILEAFAQLPSIGDNFDVLSGGNPRDDFRFVRHWAETCISPNSDFVPYSKGGEFSLYYYDVHLMLKWKNNARELKTHAAGYRESLGWSPDWRALMMNYDYYFTAGITWPRRTSRLSFRFLPKGCVFGDKSPVILARSPDKQQLIALISYLNSSAFNEIVSLMVGSSELAQSFEVGIVKACPLPEGNFIKQAANSLEIYRLLYNIDSANEDSHAYSGFWSPSSINVSLRTTFDTFSFQRFNIERIVLKHHQELEELSSFSLGLHFNNSQLTASDFSELSIAFWVSNCLSHMIGVMFGRWDIRYATGERAAPEPPDPFAPLPVCPPGMLQNAQGLPAISDADIVAATHPHPPTPSPTLGGRGEPVYSTRLNEASPPLPGVGEGAGGEGKTYPLRISWPGILVDDEGHPEDIEGRVREAIAVIWSERAEAIETEACEIVGVKSLRDYFRKPALFFADHLQRYSKSRRQAPIYWPLSTASGSYTLWLYYHRLTDQTLYSCVNDFVEPKLKVVSNQLAVVSQKAGRIDKDEKELERLTDLEGELRDFRDELLRLAAFWKPNLNDGVQITAAPLWKLFAHKPWQKKLKETWEKLEAGDYDWAHLAYSVWPDRVRAKCRTDKSLAIAQDLEALYVEPPASAKKGKGRGKKTVEVEEENE